MNKVIIFGGTTEGRRLAEILAKENILCIYCTATEYGKEPIRESACIFLHSGRMNSDEMCELYECERPYAVIDATHPFAEVVKREIETSLFKYRTVPFFRLSRGEEEAVDDSNCTYFDNAEDCAKELINTEGKIFLTTGSKELSTFCKNDGLRDRIVARIIPNEESLDICKAQGLMGNQIIAMQGPFSKRMNIAFIKEIDAKVMVLKDSGKASGAASRIEAANACGIKCFVIKRPVEKIEGLGLYEVRDKLFELFGIPVVKEAVPEVVTGSDRRIYVTMAGFGMGFGTLTKEVIEAVREADYVFGAPRLLVSVETMGVKYPYYLSKDIVPCLKEIEQSTPYGNKNAVVLFSGDTSFYSGAKKLINALKELPFCSVRLLPGVSSVSALSAKCQVDYQNAVILSAHGVKDEVWKPRFVEAVRYNENTFILTSGCNDVREIGAVLSSLEEAFGYKFKIFVGTNLYANEKTAWMTAVKCSNYNKDGLSTLLVVNPNPSAKKLAPGLKDDDFIRDKVPMSKEEIRALSICKLGLTPDSVVYDVGSGSGSVAIEMGLLNPSITVYAVEIKANACELIRKNIRKFALNNVRVVCKAAPDAMAELPAPTHVFIGGSGGRLEDIILDLKSKGSGIRVVINAVTLETIADINNVVKKFEAKDLDIAQVVVSKGKKIGDYSVMQGQNPVYIVSFRL